MPFLPLIQTEHSGEMRASQRKRIRLGICLMRPGSNELIHYAQRYVVIMSSLCLTTNVIFPLSQDCKDRRYLTFVYQSWISSHSQTRLYPSWTKCSSSNSVQHCSTIISFLHLLFTYFISRPKSFLWQHEQPLQLSEINVPKTRSKNCSKMKNVLSGRR